MGSKDFSIGEALSFGWQVTKSNILFFILLYIIISIVNFVPGVLSDAVRESSAGLSLIITLAGMVLSWVVSMGYIKILISFVDRESAEMGDLFSCFPLIFKYFFASILVGIVVLIGFVLLIIPGIIFSLMFMFYSYAIVDREAGPIESMKISADITRGAKWNLLGLLIITVLINLVGLLCLVVGLLVTIPMTSVALAHVYRTLEQQT